MDGRQALLGAAGLEVSVGLSEAAGGCAQSVRGLSFRLSFPACHTNRLIQRIRESLWGEFLESPLLPCGFIPPLDLGDSDEHGWVASDGFWGMLETSGGPVQRLWPWVSLSSLGPCGGQLGHAGRADKDPPSGRESSPSPGPKFWQDQGAEPRLYGTRMEESLWSL